MIKYSHIGLILGAVSSGVSLTVASAIFPGGAPPVYIQIIIWIGFSLFMSFFYKAIYEGDEK